MVLPEANAFQVVRAGTRPLFSIPRAPLRVRSAAVRCYPGHTWKKRLVRSFVATLVDAGFDSVLWKKESSPIMGVSTEVFQNWLSDIAQALNEHRLYPAIVWPATPKRGRVYVHLLDAQGRRKAFAKIAVDSLNSRLIDNERRALEVLRDLNLRHTKVPAALVDGSVAGNSWLLLEPAPPNARTTNWKSGLKLADNIREFAGPVRHVPFASIETKWWWERFTESRVPNSAFVDAVSAAAVLGVDVCRAHGDLNQTNVLRENERIWILDWEQSSEEAPCLTDFICTEVDKRWRATLRNPAASLDDFLRALWQGREQEYRNRVLLALAFLAGAKFTPALVLIDSWRRCPAIP